MRCLSAVVRVIILVLFINDFTLSSIQYVEVKI